MNSLVTSPRSAFPALTAWLENPWPFSGTNAMRIEESTQDGRYVVRAELPGFDSDKHIAVTAHGGLLTITADRQARESGNGRSEFSYGTFSRTMALPAGADSSAITAKYTDGILEVSMPHAEHPSDKHVTIQVAKA
jgi:HSP20 family protein